MSPAVAFLLSLLVPVLPWIALSSWWVAQRGSVKGVWLLLLFGVVVDIWWVKTLGSTSLLLGLMVIALYFGSRAWPGSLKSFNPVALILSLVIFEVYLILL